ncbi:hypothetical protein [Bacteroides timonensis]|nr:hypothetical protein [Bacteroides timonensis]
MKMLHEDVGRNIVEQLCIRSGDSCGTTFQGYTFPCGWCSHRLQKV